MSATLAILRLLSNGKPHTARSMSVQTGFSLNQVYNAMRVLRKHKAMRAEDQPYTITSVGNEWLQAREEKALRVEANKHAKKRPMGRPPLPEDVRVSRDMARRKQLAEKRRAERELEIDPPVVHSIVTACGERDAIVSTAINKQPALQSAWGALA